MSFLLYLTAIVQFVLIIYLSFRGFKQGSASLFLWGGLLVLFGFPQLVTSFSSNPQYPAWVYIRTSVFAISFMIIYMITMLILEKTKGKKYLIESLDYTQCHQLDENNRIRNYYIITLFVCFFIVVLFVRSVTGSVFDASWGEVFYATSSVYEFGLSLGTLFNYTNTFNVVSSGIIVYFLFKKKYIWLAVVCAMLLSEALIVGEKARLLSVAVPVVIYVLVKNRNLTLKNLLKYIALVGLGFCGIMFMAYTRSNSIEDTLNNFSLESFLTYLSSAFSNFDGELGRTEVFYKFVFHDNQFKGFNTGAGYIRILLWWLPTRFSFGLKPPDFAVTMDSAVLGYEQTVSSTHPTLFGDAFANFYYFGILLGIFWAFFVFYLERFIQSRRSYMVRIGMTSALAQMYIMIARGSIYNSVYTIILSSILLGIAYFVTHKIKIKY